MSTPEQQLIQLINNDCPTTSYDTQQALVSLNQITETQTKLKTVEENLKTIFDTMADNPSIFSQASEIWGGLPLWQKIAGGLALTVPTLAIGIFGNVTALLAISGVTVIAYTATGIILDDHNNCNGQMLERLRNGIFSLADILTITINALEVIRKQFAIAIEQFITENLKLTENVERLSTNVNSLTTNVEDLIEVEIALRTTKEELESKIKSLDQSVTEQATLLEKTQMELDIVRKEYEQGLLDLSEKTVELKMVRTSMEHEIEKTKAISNTLVATMSTLTGTVCADKDKRKMLNDRLEHFMTNSEESFDKIAVRISDAERERDAAQERLEETTKRYQELLKSHETQVVRLERIDSKLQAENITLKRTLAGQFSQGFFSNKDTTIPLTTKTIMTI